VCMQWGRRWRGHLLVWAFAVSFGDPWHPQLVLDRMHCQQFIQLLEKSLARKSPTRTRIIIVVITGHCRTDSVKDALARSLPSYQFFSISSDFRKQLKSITIHPLSSVSVSWVLRTTTHPSLHKGQNPWIMNDDQPKLIFTTDFHLKMCQRKKEKQ
jgi:hypothetical protein